MFHKRTYNAVSVRTAKKFVSALRRKGYEASRKKQWVHVQAESLDMEVGRIARRYEAIAY